jgi:glutathione peroxidase-family protein
MMDAYGRGVCSDDYRGVPLLIATGACWCGGCQSDTEPLRLLEEKYHARGLQVIHSFSYDNNLPAWEFQKHYRLPFVQLLDPIREFEKHYNSDGWSFIMLADRQGNVVFRYNGSIRDVFSDLNNALESMLPKQAPVETIQCEGVSYMPATLSRSGELKKTRLCDRFPSVACGSDGRVYVVFTTNRNGTQDVFLRVRDGYKWLPDQPIAATEADEFDGTVVVDHENRPWVSWTSNAGGQYNIFVACVEKPSGKNSAKSSDKSAKQSSTKFLEKTSKATASETDLENDSEAGREANSENARKTKPDAKLEIEPIQITHSAARDDSMHGRMAVDSNGRLWVTYYQWERVYGTSRDKEVYTRYFENGRWSDVIHVSPDDVPVFEDHTDPVIVPWGDGVVIGWSWDFHRQNSTPAYSSVPDSPSIFLRKVAAGQKLERARAVSGANIDTRPTLAVSTTGHVFCAWESAVRDSRNNVNRKMITTSIEDLQSSENPGEGVNVTGFQTDICTPCLASSVKGDVALVWSQPNADNGQWMLMQAQWNPRAAAWTQPKMLVANGNPRFPSAAYGKDGSLWIAYCADKRDRREVVVFKSR